jgi:glycosyltransferase involved in cell wall biosynthesis
MRIAVVHSYYSDRQPSGENLVVDHQLDALRSAGHDVRLFGRRTDEAMQAESFYRLRCAGRVSLGAGSNPLRAIRDFDPDIVHLHNTFPNIGSSWLARSEFPLVITVHNHRFECAAATLFRDGKPCRQCLDVPVLPAIVHSCYRSRLQTLPPAVATSPGIGTFARQFRAADAIICLNSVVAEHLERGPARSQRVRILPNFAAERNGPDDGRRAAPIDALYVGRLSPEKGVARVLRDWPADRALTIVGDGPEAPRIKSFADSRPNIRLLGQVPPPAVRQLMRAARVLVIPSVCNEGFPTVALEAMQVGLPLLLSGNVTVAKTLSEHGAAAVFDFDDPHRDLVAGLSTTAQQEVAMRQNAREAYERHYSQAAWLTGIAHVYQAAIEHRGKRTRSRRRPRNREVSSPVREHGS